MPQSAKVQTHFLKVTDFRRFCPMGLQFGEHTAPEGVGSFVYEVQSSITKESAQQ